MEIKYFEPRFDREIGKLAPGTVFSTNGTVLIRIDDEAEYLTSHTWEGDVIPCLEMETGKLTMLEKTTMVTPRADAYLSFEGNISPH